MAELIGSPYTQTAISNFNDAYPDHPWAGITTKERTFYDPILRDVYRQTNVFGQFATFVQNVGDKNTKTMVISSLYDIHPNFDRLGLREMYLPAAHVDSRSQEITFERYGGKVAYHTYDDIITYWSYNGGNASAIRRIVNDKLGRHMVDVQDMLARNALLAVPFSIYGSDGARSSFNDLTTADKANKDLLNDIHLGMKYRNVPYAQSGNGSVGTITCITSPGVLYDIQNTTEARDWLTPMAYADPNRLLNYEVGTYRNVRFVETPKCTLFNAGPITVQGTITTAINAGDGSPDPATTLVDKTYKSGQPAAAHYIEVTMALADFNQIKVNDIVSIHQQRTADFGVTNGVDYREGKLTHRRVVAVSAQGSGTGPHRISFDQPIMVDFTTNLGGGVYAYLTKGMHVHAMIFVGGRDGIVMGVGRPPRLHAPGPVDDFDSIYRFTWDSFQGYLNYNPAVLEVAFVAGSFRNVGPLATQG